MTRGAGIPRGFGVCCPREEGDTPVRGSAHPIAQGCLAKPAPQGKSLRLTHAKPFPALRASTGHKGQPQLHLLSYSPWSIPSLRLSCAPAIAASQPLDLILASVCSGTAPSDRWKTSLQAAFSSRLTFKHQHLASAGSLSSFKGEGE